MTQALSVLLAILLGSGGAVQVGLLSAMSRQRGTIEATWISVLGTVCVMSLVFLVQTVRGAPLALPSPFDSWITYTLSSLASGTLLALAIAGLPLVFVITGVFAVPFLIGASFLAPRLGVGLFLGSIITGQLLAGLVIDHVGAFGAEARPVDVVRLLGVVALVAGVILIRGFR